MSLLKPLVGRQVEAPLADAAEFAQAQLDIERIQSIREELMANAGSGPAGDCNLEAACGIGQVGRLRFDEAPTGRPANFKARRDSPAATAKERQICRNEPNSRIAVLTREISPRTIPFRAPLVSRHSKCGQGRVNPPVQTSPRVLVFGWLGERRLEPRQTESEFVVLPLHHSPNYFGISIRYRIN